MEFYIRNVELRDIPALILLCKEHAEFEKADYMNEGKAEKLAEGFFSRNPALYGLVVESNDTLVGFLTYMTQYSTWDAEQYLYMDCIFLKEKFRGNGIGNQLIERMKQNAKEVGINTIQWQTPDFNEGAIRFYKRIGAISKPKERFFLKL